MRIILPLMALLFFFLMILFPQESFQAATLGLNTWWTIVFPSLLPFFIVAELSLGLGLVHFISVLLEPIMRPLFNLPGAAAIVVALGYSSGFPVGATLTTELRQKRLITRLEGERLLAFTNNASPLFIFVAVSVGILGEPAMGILLALAHYLANFILGILLRFYGRKDPEKTHYPSRYRQLVGHSFQAMFAAQRVDGRPLGKLIRDAVQKSILNLAVVGGFIIFFAVLIMVFRKLGISLILEKFLALVFYPLHLPQELIAALNNGVLEMTLGCKAAGESLHPLHLRVVVISMIMGWSGISVHAQIAGIVSSADLSCKVYLYTRFAHMLFSGFLAYVLLKGQAVTVFKAWMPLVLPSPLTYIFLPFAFFLLVIFAGICLVLLRVFLEIVFK